MKKPLMLWYERRLKNDTDCDFADYSVAVFTPKKMIVGGITDG